MSCLLVSLLLAGCQPLWTIHDRHVGAYSVVTTWSQAHPGGTLVLLDYHPDAGGLRHRVNSTNWVGHLVAQGRLAQVVWVSARRFAPGQRESRARWLDRLLADDGSAQAQRVRGAYVVADGTDLEGWEPTGPWIVSIDADVWAHDAGSPPGRWLAEVDRWMSRHRPDRGLWALSSTYQPEAAPAWAWTEAWGRGKTLASAWVRFEAGDDGLGAEGPEEKGLREPWKNGQPFWPGAAVWLGAPGSLRQLAVDRGWSGVDPAGVRVLSAWADPDQRALEALVSPDRGALWWTRARDAVTQAWAGHPSPEPSPRFLADLGLAVRLANPLVDRGCLAWYRGVADPEATVAWCATQALVDPRYPAVRPDEAPTLDLEVSVFGPWRPIDRPQGFRLGWDSLLLEKGKERTLLQASVAVERGHSSEVFLDRLSRKAGLGPGGWKAPDVRIFRAATLFFIAPLVTKPGQKNSW